MSGIKSLRKESLPPDYVCQFPNDSLITTMHADMLSAKQEEKDFQTVAEVAEINTNGEVILTDGTTLQNIEVINARR